VAINVAKERSPSHGVAVFGTTGNDGHSHVKLSPFCRE